MPLPPGMYSGSMATPVCPVTACAMARETWAEPPPEP